MDGLSGRFVVFLRQVIRGLVTQERVRADFRGPPPSSPSLWPALVAGLSEGGGRQDGSVRGDQLGSPELADVDPYGFGPLPGPVVEAEGSDRHRRPVVELEP